MRDEPEGLGLFCHTRFPAISNGRLVGGAFVAWGGPGRSHVPRLPDKEVPASAAGYRVRGGKYGGKRRGRAAPAWGGLFTHIGSDSNYWNIPNFRRKLAVDISREGLRGTWITAIGA